MKEETKQREMNHKHKSDSPPNKLMMHSKSITSDFKSKEDTPENKWCVSSQNAKKNEENE